MNHHSFEDYYEDLQVSPNADFETIERVYRLLAKRYHPDNTRTGRLERFEAISSAYRVLGNPEKRAAYDVLYEKQKDRYWRIFSEDPSNEGIEDDERIRNQLLSILYRDRRENPSDSSVGIWYLERLTGWPAKILDFHIWYLKEKGCIHRTDSGGFAITASGVDLVDKSNLILTKNRLLPEQTV